MLTVAPGGNNLETIFSVPINTYYYYYCNLWKYRIPRHMMCQHKEEPRVKLIILKMGKGKQNMEFSKLRREGDYNSNMLKLKEKIHNLTVVRS